jgi:hypothetical protein
MGMRDVSFTSPPIAVESPHPPEWMVGGAAVIRMRRQALIALASASAMEER